MFNHAKKKIKEGVKESLFEAIKIFLDKLLGEGSPLTPKQQRLLNL